MNTELFTLGETSFTPYSILVISGVLICTYLISRITQRIVGQVLSKASESAPGLTASTQRLVHYLIMVVGIIVALELVGFDLKALFAAGALLAIAIGFAMQNLTQNFVSGVILLTERSIKPGDVLEVEGKVVKVTRMGLRATIARTREETEIIIPNSILVQTSVSNYTFRDTVFRIRVPVGVAYSTDVEEATRILTEMASAVIWRNTDYEPVTFITDFGDSSIVLEVSVFVDDPWKARFHYSDLRMLVWKTLKEHQITIAFPQMDVHFDPSPQTIKIADTSSNSA